jgi:hypothetical protein
MTILVPEVPAGIVLPASVMHTQFFAVLAAFVAINTIVYAALSVARILPRIYLSDWVHGRNRRAETRSIYPDAPP